MPEITGKNVLIVEDESSLAQLYSHHLGEYHDVSTAQSGKQGLAELSPDTDLIFLDRKLGDMSGDEVIEKVRNTQTDCQIIMVTAVDPEFDIIEMEIEGYINKPIEKKEMLDAADQALLMKEYEKLLEEFYRLRKKKATVAANYSTSKLEQTDDKRYKWLVDRLDEVEEKIGRITQMFPDEELAEAFRSVHTYEDFQ